MEIITWRWQTYVLNKLTQMLRIWFIIAAEIFLLIFSNTDTVIIVVFNLVMQLSHFYFLQNAKCFCDIFRTLWPYYFWRIKNLKEVFFYCNKIEALSENVFEPLVNLKYFSNICNQISKIQKNLFKKSLELGTIWFNNNNIKSVCP